MWTDSRGFGSNLVQFLPASSMFNLRLVSRCHFELTEKWRKAAVLWHRVRLGVGDEVDPAVVLQGAFVLKHIELAQWTGCGLTALFPNQRTSSLLEPLPDVNSRLIYHCALNCGERPYTPCFEAVCRCEDMWAGEGAETSHKLLLKESLDTHISVCVDLDFLKCLWTPQQLVVCDVEAVRTRSSVLSERHCRQMTRVVSRHTPFQESVPRYRARLLRYLDRGFKVRNVHVETGLDMDNAVVAYVHGLPLYSFSYRFEDSVIERQYRDFIASQDRPSLESLESLVHELTMRFRTTGTEVCRVPVSR